MRAVVQRVQWARVSVEGKVEGEIGRGLLVLVGVAAQDQEADIELLARKLVNLRIFEDEQRKMNLSLLDIKGELLLISQFTLYADCRKGRRPSFIGAAPPEFASEMFDRLVKQVRSEYPIKVEQGVFQAMMDIELMNYGPVTILLDTEELK